MRGIRRSQIQSPQSRKTWQADTLVCVTVWLCACVCVRVSVLVSVVVRKLTLSLYSWHSSHRHQVGVKVVRLVIARRPFAVTALSHWSVEFNIVFGKWWTEGVGMEGEGHWGCHRAWRCVVLRCVAFIWFVVLHSLAWFPFPLHSILLMPSQRLCLWLPEQTDWLNAIDVALGAECCATFLLPLVYVRVFLFALPSQFCSVQFSSVCLPCPSSCSACSFRRLPDSLCFAIHFQFI